MSYQSQLAGHLKQAAKALSQANQALHKAADLAGQNGYLCSAGKLSQMSSDAQDQASQLHDLSNALT